MFEAFLPQEYASGAQPSRCAYLALSQPSPCRLCKMLASSHCNADIVAIPQLRSIKEQREAEWEEERLRANVGLDELSSQHQVELARQNRQLNELRLQAEQRVRRPRNARSRSILLHYLPASSDYRPLTDRADTGMLWHRTHVIFAGTRGGAGATGDPPSAGRPTAEGETRTMSRLAHYIIIVSLLPAETSAVSLASLNGVAQSAYTCECDPLAGERLSANAARPHHELGAGGSCGNLASRHCGCAVQPDRKFAFVFSLRFHVSAITIESVFSRMCTFLVQKKTLYNPDALGSLN